MDKRTLLAVVISVAILIAGTLIQQWLFPAPPSRQTPTPAATQPATEGQQGSQPQPQPAGASTTAGQQAPGKPAGIAAPGVVVPVPQSGAIQPGLEKVERDTSLFHLTFSREGGVLTSIQLKKFKNANGSLVDMVLPSTTGQYPFDISFGDYKTPWITVAFDLKETVSPQQSVFEFSRAFLSVTGVPFTLRKTYVFHNDEYMMELRVSLENSVNDVPDLGPGTYAYSLSIGPQIGPPFLKLDGRSEYRSFFTYSNNKLKDLGGLSGQVKESSDSLTWAGIVGKYFTVLAIPDANQYRYIFDAEKLVPNFDRSALSIERPRLKAAKTQDVFRFYIGPKMREILSRYNDTGNNTFAVSDLKLDEVIKSPPIIGGLARLLSWFLLQFFKAIPNYGVDIILLTLFLKLIFLPLTFRSSEATARMQALNPKISEIRERLKGKPDKMNQEIAELYRREKINPLSGCLPLLLQLPILWAFYSMLSDNFFLRGSGFIAGWITDLSAPEAVWDFSPFTIPIAGWHSLRILPFLMLATQFLTTKVTTPQDSSQQGAQMKLFTYVLPAVFFFILYDMPSGLVLYWTVQNIFSIFQQLYINSVNKKKKLMAGKVEVVNTRRK